MNWSSLGNTLWTLVSVLESTAFVLAVMAFVLAWAWGKNGLKKLTRKQETLALKAAGWSALVKLVLMAFTLVLNLIFYFKR
jgi:hypothetical protein